MRLSFLSLLLIISYISFAQQPVFKAFETDTAAEPHGGMAFLTTFIQTNLRKPIAAEAKGVGGRAILSGIVETDGRISEVKLLNSFRPDCDREALRVFKLFNAWKPAYKDGKPVRQEVIMPVLFKPNDPFVYTNGAKVDYFERNNKLILQDTSQAFYKRVTPVDTNGISIGDIIVYEMKDKGWTEYFRLPFTTRKYYNYDMPAKPLHSVGNQNYKQDWEGVVYVLDDTGKIIRQSYYENGKRIGS